MGCGLYRLAMAAIAVSLGVSQSGGCATLEHKVEDWIAALNDAAAFTDAAPSEWIALDLQPAGALGLSMLLYDGPGHVQVHVRRWQGEIESVALEGAHLAPLRAALLQAIRASNTPPSPILDGLSLDIRWRNGERCVTVQTNIGGDEPFAAFVAQLLALVIDAPWTTALKTELAALAHAV